MAHPRDILKTLGAEARRNFSQNFLTSPHWIHRFATQALASTSAFDEVWEIGPGLGAITAELLRLSPTKVVAFEIDRKLAAYLRLTFPSLELLEGDVLEADFSGLAAGKRVSLISNLPYHLSSPILFKLIDHKPVFTQLVLTFQKEFAERLLAQPGDAAYSGLSVLAQMHFELHSLGVLPPGAFYPAPAISSETLVLVPKPLSVDNWVRFSRLVKTAFAHRRKKLSKNLSHEFPGIDWEARITALGFTASARPEELSKEHYTSLAKALDK